MILKKILASLLFLLIADISAAQDWVQTNGPSGGLIKSITVNQNGDIFVASQALHRSTDGGKTWMQIFSNAAFGSITKVIAQPSGVLFALVQFENNTDTSRGGIYRSINNGTSWEKLFFRENLWSGKGGYLFTNDYDNLEYSTDDGVSWKRAFLPGIVQIFQITSDLAGNFFLFYVFPYRSSDKGENWKMLTTFPYTEISNLSLSPHDELFATKKNLSAGGSLIRSTDKGETWKTDTVPRSNINTISFTDKGGIFVGGNPSFFSYDNGKTWIPVMISGRMPLPNVNCSAAEPSGSFLFSTETELFRFNPIDTSVESISIPNGKVTAMIDDNGMITAFTNRDDITIRGWQSSDKGSQWKLFSQNLKNKVTDVIKDSAGNFFAASGGALIRLKDSQSTFFSGTTIEGMVVRQNGDIFVAYNDFQGWVSRSTDNGDSWKKISTGLYSTHVYSIAVDKESNVYVGGGSYFFVLKNDDTSWQSLTSNLGEIQATIITPDGSILVQEYWFGTVSRSLDKGVTWTELTTGIPRVVIRSLICSPNGSTFAATNEGVYRLDSGSHAWLTYSLGLTSKKILCLTSDAQGHIYAGSDGSGVFRSKEPFNTTVNLSPYIVVDDVDFDSVAAGSEVCKDIFIRNLGNAPLIINKNFIVKDQFPFSVDTISSTFPLTIKPNDSIKIRVCFHPPQDANYSSEIDWSTNIAPEYIGPMKHISFLKGKTPDKTKVGDATRDPLSISLHPNPVSGNSITLSLSQPLSQSAGVSLYDVLGKELWKSWVSVGEKELTIPIQNLAKGMYYVRILSGETTITKEFLKQ